VADDDAGRPPGAPAHADPGYPLHWEADVVLRDGGTAHVRPIRPDDADALQAFHVGQSARSTYLRFFAPLERLPEAELHRLTHVDHHDRVALVAVAEDDEPGEGTAGRPDRRRERIIAVGRYDRTGPGTAEVAFNVADAHHGRGLGSVLLEHLAAAARERGIHRFTAEVLPQNGRMLAVFREAGYAVEQRLDDGIVWVSFDVDPTERSLAVMADREHHAEARSVLGLLTPSSVLVVTDPAAPDHAAACAVVRHLVEAPGHVPVVHVVGWPDAPDPALPYPGVRDVPGPVDLLVLGVAAQRCAEVVRACARLRPHGVLVLSTGFAETGPEGREHQRALLRAAHATGARVLGPGSYGFVRHGADGAPTVNASLATPVPARGRLGLFCQSAPMAVGLLASAGRRGLGLSTFVSSGHRADVSGNDLMQFWTEDGHTDVVAAYLESIGNPRKFVRVARRLAAAKPVVVLTAGSSGHVAPAGHVLRGTRVPRRVLDDLLRQSGVVRATSQHHLLDVAQLLVHQPLPAGGRVTVVAGSEPMAALVAEAATSAGLEVTSRRAILAAGHGGPEDLARLDADLAAAFADPDGDVVVVVHVPTLGPPYPEVARSVARAAAASGRTTVACIRGLSGVTEALTAPGPDGAARTVPAYAAPEDGVAALAAAVRYARWRSADHGRPLAPVGVDRAAARRVVAEALDGAREGAVVALDDARAAALLGAYGIEVWPSRAVATADEAVAAADEVGWPVALKSAARSLRHRVDLGGVRLDIAGPDALRDAVAQMGRVAAAHGAADAGFLVQRMAPAGVACVVRSTEDPRFGPVVSFSLAGDALLLDDVAHAVAPLTDVDVAELVRSVRAAPRLLGQGDLPPLDVAALEDVLARVAVLAEDTPALHALELYPVVVGERGAAVLAARVELAEAERADGTRRALPG
jgi:acyl-CoA synthetase (NDP forming)/RimJ/RimL family protein N-acetyltransferase